MTFQIGPDGLSESKIMIYKKKPFLDLDHELIERKGIGHPDTIADRLASEISRQYSRYTYEHCDGQILHHQIDKLMVIGGKTEVTWGAGRFVEPIKIIVAGRVSGSYLGIKIPVGMIINNTVRDYFAEFFSLVDFEKDILVENKLTSNPGPGTIVESKGSIASMFEPKQKGIVRGYEQLVANDTSYCVYYSSNSKLERAVLDVEQYLNSSQNKKDHPWLGSDIKIMAIRNHKEFDITLCIPQIAKYVESSKDYIKNLEHIGGVIDEKFRVLLKPASLNISINTKDDYEKNNFYLTVSGASLSGDIGVVGRGNRTNGLITANRPMSMEGSNGKNPRYYSGFIYAVLSKRISCRIRDEIGEENIVEIVSQNGGPLLKPWRVNVVCNYEEGLIKKLVLDECSKIELITEDFMNGNLGYLS